MKTIKINFVGFWPDFSPTEFFLTKILQKYYNVVITEDADYIFCSGFGFYEYLNYPQVRIMFSGENYVPEFNYVDYAISVYPIELMDRHFSFPGMVLSSYDFLEELSKKDRNYSAEILKEKSCFANMIASHESENNIRGDLFRLLSQYKRVEAGGSYLNNMPDGQTVKMRDGSKFALQKKCKFTLCGESLMNEGFITEKIFDAFLADTIPIYYGSSTISDIINKNAYIDIRNYDNLEDVVERIIELDKDDNKYLEVLRQPVFVKEDYVEKKIEELERFVRNVFDQPLEKAYRRCKSYMPAVYERELVQHKECLNWFWVKLPYILDDYFWKMVGVFVRVKRYVLSDRKP